jgi:RNA 2',3'-cyclic 3'-phosphodiesterase
MGTTMADRLFVGIPLTDLATTELSRQLRHAFPTGLPGRQIPPENWHLTLRFLGDVLADLAGRFRGEMGAGGMGKPFHVAFGRLGAFPDPRRARVLWVGVTDGAEALGRLAEAVEGRVRRVGLPAEGRPYAPHLTLSRLREPQDLRSLLAAATSPDVDLAVKEVVLFRSHLGGAAPRYEVVERFPL